ncbi:MAG: phage portal protein [Peptostreptococcaceae bacterium]|nr:phage portal protein [Peptostreptococcaceae bacterium]
MVNMDLIKKEIEGIYGAEVTRDMTQIIRLYDIYEGKGQEWETPVLDYEPTKKITNFIKKLIKEEARFLFGKSPEIRVLSDNKEAAEEIQAYLEEVLKKSLFRDKLLKGARDCFIGKRVALKLSGGEGTPIKVSFRPALEFVFEPKDDDVDELDKILFFYAINQKDDKREQRFWKQKYYMENERCFVDEGIYNGNGELIESILDHHDTGLNFIPAYVILNDGLTGDLKGESDVEELQRNQMIFNKLSSDDVDALRFNLFPQTVATDAEEESLKDMIIAPGALIELHSDPSSEKQAQMGKLESSFGYGEKLENTLDRIKSELFEALNIPMLTLEDLKGVMTSGKSMKALYWQLITRCEEKYMAWQPALEWMCLAILEMTKAYHLQELPALTDLRIEVQNVYPLLEDEQEEKTLDMQEVTTKVRSIKSYLKKWENLEGSQADDEINQIKAEKDLLESDHIFGEAMRDE